MNCDDVRAWLRRDLDGAAEPSADGAEHLDRCTACREEASRLKGIAATGRDALPGARVPLDFTEQVMAGIEMPPADEALARAAGPRIRSWMPVAAALLLVPLIAWWWQRPAAVVEGDLQVERDGLWHATETARRGETFGLAPGAVARADGVTVTALTRSLLRAGRPLRLLGGHCVVTAGGEPARVETPLGRIDLRAHSACEVSLRSEQEEQNMTFRSMMRTVPAALAMTLFAGGATVVNAQGEAEAGQPGESVKTNGGAPELAKINREIERTQVRLDRALAEIAELKAELAARKNGREERVDRLPDIERKGRGRLQGQADTAALRAEYERTKKRLAEIERVLKRRDGATVEELVAAANAQRAALHARVAKITSERQWRDELDGAMDLAKAIHRRGAAAKKAKQDTHAESLARALVRIEEAVVLLHRGMELQRKIDADAENVDVLEAELADIRRRIAAISKNIQKAKKRSPKGAR